MALYTAGFTLKFLEPDIFAKLNGAKMCALVVCNKNFLYHLLEDYRALVRINMTDSKVFVIINYCFEDSLFAAQIISKLDNLLVSTKNSVSENITFEKLQEVTLAQLTLQNIMLSYHQIKNGNQFNISLFSNKFLQEVNNSKDTFELSDVLKSERCRTLNPETSHLFSSSKLQHLNACLSRIYQQEASILASTANALH